MLFNYKFIDSSELLFLSFILYCIEIKNTNHDNKPKKYTSFLCKINIDI